MRHVKTMSDRTTKIKNSIPLPEGKENMSKKKRKIKAKAVTAKMGVFAQDPELHFSLL